MKRYIAFLRGINISGKNKIEMAALKEMFEELGCRQVVTYLNSGNVSFFSEEQNLRQKIEERIHERFDLDIPVYVMEAETLQDILANAPSWWDAGSKEKYDNLIFLLSSESPEAISERIGEPSEGMEQIQIYQNVIFWTFDRKLYQKCNWWKRTALAGIAENLTIRTANTVKKVSK